MLDKVFNEMIDAQRSKLFTYATRIIPTLTQDDLLQPNDFPVLEQHPAFRYEEGVLAGLLAARTAYLASVNLSQ